MRPPVCEICDADLDPADVNGGLVTFQPDDRSRDWRRRAAEEPGFVGHPPDTGWFCGAHIDAARVAARSLAFPEGLRRLRADSEAPDATTPDLGAGPGPDLVGVELGSGRLVAGDEPGHQWVEWTVTPIDAHTFAASLRSVIPALMAELDLAPAPELEQRTDRRWNPMDGAQPPWCPFTDTTVEAGLGSDGTQVELQVVLNHWNDDEVANATVTLTIGDRLFVSAFQDGAGRDIGTVRLWRPTAAGVVAVVAGLVH